MSTCLPKQGKKKIGEKTQVLWAKVKTADGWGHRSLKVRLPNAPLLQGEPALLRNKIVMVGDGASSQDLWTALLRSGHAAEANRKFVSLK